MHKTNNKHRCAADSWTTLIMAYNEHLHSSHVNQLFPRICITFNFLRCTHAIRPLFQSPPKCLCSLVFHHALSPVFLSSSYILPLSCPYSLTFLQPSSLKARKPIGFLLMLLVPYKPLPSSSISVLPVTLFYLLLVIPPLRKH